jgi:hypothetical protein
MSTKTKIAKSDRVADVATQAGMVLMTAAATIGILELGTHPNKQIVVPGQPKLAFETNQAGVNPQETNPLRREREETAPHYISYNVNQRTPGRTGKA